MNMQAFFDWINSSSVDQELLFMAFILVTTILIVMTLGFAVMGINSPLRRTFIRAIHCRYFIPSSSLPRSSA